MGIIDNKTRKYCDRRNDKSNDYFTVVSIKFYFVERSKNHIMMQQSQSIIKRYWLKHTDIDN